jgi:N-acetylneuraminic acid mutarotase
MSIPRLILRRFGVQLRVARGWRALVALAITTVLLSCGGSSDNDVAGPSMAVVTATRLVFTVEPNATTATAAIFPAVQVTAQDASGNTVTGFKSRVSMVIGHNPTGGSLSGGSATAINGVATFTNLIIGKAGTGYTLIATYGKLADTSVAFNVALPATQLIFSVQPSTTSQGATISPAVQVTALDKKGNLAEGYRQNVTVAIRTNPGAGTLAGTTTVAAVHGVATFSDLSIDKVGSGYTLRATSLKLAEVTSAAFDIASAGNFWTELPPMPTARYGVAAAAIGDILYVVGGYSNNYLTTLEAYNTVTHEWSTKAPMSTARLGPGLVAVNGILYAFGGYSPNGNGGAVATIEAYDPNDGPLGTWTTETTSMATARYFLGGAAINGILYAAGGFSGPPSYAALRTLEAYVPGTGWTTAMDMPTARYQVAAAAIGDILYAVGGDDTQDGLGTLEAYNPALPGWTTKTSMPTPRGGLGVAALNGSLYAVGGYGDYPYDPIATFEVYDPNGGPGGTWVTKTTTPMPTARSSLGVAAINGILYAVGGQSTPGTYLATLEAYHP